MFDDFNDVSSYELEDMLKMQRRRALYYPREDIPEYMSNLMEIGYVIRRRRDDQNPELVRFRLTQLGHDYLNHIFPSDEE